MVPPLAALLEAEAARDDSAEAARVADARAASAAAEAVASATRAAASAAEAAVVSVHGEVSGERAPLVAAFAGVQEALVEGAAGVGTGAAEVGRRELGIERVGGEGGGAELAVAADEPEEWIPASNAIPSAPCVVKRVLEEYPQLAGSVAGVRDLD